MTLKRDWFLLPHFFCLVKATLVDASLDDIEEKIKSVSTRNIQINIVRRAFSCPPTVRETVNKKKTRVRKKSLTTTDS